MWVTKGRGAETSIDWHTSIGISPLSDFISMFYLLDKMCTNPPPFPFCPNLPACYGNPLSEIR